MVRSIYGLEVPSIAAVNGAAIGLGCDVACMTDIRIAADSAKFGVTFLKLGLIPGDGGAWLLPRTIGMSRAAELLFTGEVIDARTAEAWGLVSRVVPTDKLIEEALAAAKTIGAMSLNAVMLTKEMVDAAYETPLGQGIMLERRLFHSLFAFDDQKEGMAAFIDKRKPAFTGH